MNFEECMKFISSYSRLGAKVTDLSRAQELMECIGNPEKNLKFVHIAGTNGKGSTLEYIATALELSGYKVGKLTSPYVTHYTDRIRVNSQEIDEASLGKICEIVKKNVADRKYSQFEITMAIAFLWFKKENCDIVILETGIGGLLDSTNIIPPPLLSVITSVSFDHTDILGNTLDEIAVQKAGIIKKDSSVILSMDNFNKTFEIIAKTAEEKNAKFITPDQNSFTMLPFNFESNSFIYKNQKYHTTMLGKHQAINAVTSIEACHYLSSKGFKIPEESIYNSLFNTQVKARIQYISSNPPVIVDGGHNISGIAVLISVLKKLITAGKSLYGIMGMTDSKDYTQCTKKISGCFEKMFIVDNFAENAVSANKLAEIASEYTDAEASTLTEAISKSTRIALKNNGIVVICGSLYLASEFFNMKEDR